MYYIEWGLGTTSPSYFKHEINLYNWLYHPSEASFVETTSLARLFIMPGNKILDLCCGDGSYTYLFFSDIAGDIDAIDYGQEAINYAKHNYQSKNINYIQADLLKYTFNENYYQMVVWSAGVAYFIKKERIKIFEKIYNSLEKGGYLYIKTPLEIPQTKTPSANQKELITDQSLFEEEFKKLFKIEFFKILNRPLGKTLIYILKK